MSISTLSTVYAYNNSYAGSTAYDAKNNAAKMLIEHMAATPIAGLSYYDKVSPAISTSAAQTFSVTFQTIQGYYLQFAITTSTSSSIPMVFSFLSENAAYSSGRNMNGVMSFSSNVATVGLMLVRYYSENIYDIYAASVLTSSTTFVPLGALYLINKTATAPDYVVCGHNSVAYLYDATNNRPLTTLLANSPDELTGACIMFDAPVFYENAFLATIKNSKIIGFGTTSQNLTTYYVGENTYIAVAYRRICVKVT